MIHAFGYAYLLSGDVKFRQWGDEVIDATFSHAVVEGLTIRYLPDFLLLDVDGSPEFWIEVKPFMPTTMELYKLWLLCHTTERDGFLLMGEPSVEGSNFYVPHSPRPVTTRRQPDSDAPSFSITDNVAFAFRVGSAQRDEAYAKYNALLEDLAPRGHNDPTVHAVIQAEFSEVIGIVQRAYDAARSARFEFGESG
jgi:hypothetical protein